MRPLQIHDAKVSPQVFVWFTQRSRVPRRIERGGTQALFHHVTLTVVQFGDF
jgi:hypothetical protein